MAINFPNSPSLNETYSENDTSWKWDGTSWNRLTGLVGTESSTLSGVGVTQFARRDVNNVITGITTLSTSGVGNTTLNVEGDSRFGSNIKVTGVSTFTGGANVPDSSGSATALNFGDDKDLKIYHRNTGHSYINNATGDLILTNTGDDVIIQSADDIQLKPQGGNSGINVIGAGSVELYEAGDKKFETTLTGASVTGDLAASGNVTGVAATFTGDVKIGGVLTYEDVKNVDSVGIITARGVIDAQGYINLAQKIIHTGDADTSIEFDTNTIKFETAGSERLRITSGGNVGVGTDNPLAPLHIFDTVDTTLRLESADNGAVYHSLFRDNAGTKTRIGYMGFGGTGGTMNIANEVPNGNIFFQTTPSGASAGAEETAFRIHPDKKAETYGDLQIPDKIIHTSDTDTAIRFADTNTITAETAGSERLRITSGGNVGIGSVIPEQRLTVAGVTDITHYNNSTINNNRLQLGFNAPEGYIKAKNSVASPAANLALYTTDTSGNTNKVVHCSYTGKVGIGSVSPGQKLDVAGNILTRSSDNTAQFQHNAVKFQTSGGAHIDHETTNQNLNFRVTKSSTADTNMMQIHAASEQTKFHKVVTVGLQGGGDTTQIGGGSGIGAYLQLNYANNNIVNTKLMGNNDSWLNSHYGNLGIGTQSPSRKLTLAAASGSTIFELKRTNTNSTGAVGTINFTANDGHSVANIQVRGDGNDEGGAIQFRTTSAAASNDPYAAPHNGLIAMQIKSDGQTVLDGGASQTVNYPIQINNSAAAGNGSNPDITAIAFASGAATKASIQAAVYGEGWMTFHNNNNTEKLRIDASGHILPGAAGTQNLGSTSKEWGDVFIADSKNIQFGNDQDLKIGFDSSNSLIDVQTGSLSIINYANNEDVKILSDNGSGGVTNYIIADGGSGEVLLHHYGSQKFATSTTGITVTGEVAASQDYPNQRPSVDFNFVSVKKLDSRITYNRTGPASYTDEFGKVVLVGANTPRFDHDLTTRESKGLLIEEARTNQIKYSHGNGFKSQGAMGDYTEGWVQQSTTNSTITQFAAEGPDGTTSALKYTLNSTSGRRLDYEGLSVTNGTVYCWSWWMKRLHSGSVWTFQSVGGTAVTNTAVFIDGVDSGATGTYTPTDDEWHRVTWRFTAGATATQDFGGYDSSGNTGDRWLLWGAQFEAGIFPTSLIPTNGTTATRGQGFAVIDGEELSDFYNPNASTVICQFDASNWVTYNPNKYDRVWSFSNHNTETDTIEMFKQNSSNSQVRWRIRTSNTNVLGASNYTYSTTRPKLGFAWQLNDAGVSIDGGTVSGTGDSNIPLPSITKLSLGNSGIENNNGGHGLTGWIRRFIYYPIKVSDEQLVTLTS